MCKVWATIYGYTDVGEHNHCRNPIGDSAGVWCFTSDNEFEFSSVPHCDPTYDCQEGDPLGVSYSGIMNTTVTGMTCKVWAATDFPLGEHNHCRNQYGNFGGVWCFTTDPDTLWEYCSVPRCVNKGTPP